MKRIAFFIDGQFKPSRDGGSTTILEFLFFLKKQGNEVYLFNFVTNEFYNPRYFFECLLGFEASDVIRSNKVFCSVLNGINIYQEILPYGVNEIPKHHQKIVKLIIRKIAEHKIDYIYTADSPSISLLPVYLSGVAGAHFFNSLDNVKSFIPTDPIYRRILQKRTVFAVSRFIQMKLKELFGVSALVWHPIINFDKYISSGKENKTKTIGFFSGGIPYCKGNELVNKIITKMPEGYFIIVGERYFNQFKQIPPNLKYLGHTTNMKEFYGQIKLLLVPSIVEEAFSRVILEAAINGIPVIANRIGGIPEALEDGGILIDIDLTKKLNLDEIADKYIFEINRFLNNDDSYARYSKKAILRAEKYKAEQDEMSKYLYENF